VPDPAPGAALIKVALANVCGSDMHYNVGWETKFDPAWILFCNRRIIGVAHYEAEHLKGALDLMTRTRQKYPYDRILSHTFPLEKINEAFRQQEDGHITRGAIAPN